MNQNKKLQPKTTRALTSLLKILLIFALIINFGLFNYGCQKSEELIEPTVIDEYYVKYKVYGTGNIKRILQTTIKTENNGSLTYNIETSKEWETIIGPVGKGFNATLEVTSEYDVILNTSIYVSKNNSPFAIKQYNETETVVKYIKTSYTIDY